MSLKRTLLFVGVGVVALVLVVGLWVAVWVTRSMLPAPPPKLPPVELKAEVRVKDGHLIVTNNDDFPYERAVAWLNPETFSSGYGFRLGDIQPGKQRRVSVISFANSDSQRFNPFTTVISTVQFEACVKGQKVVYVNNDRMPDQPYPYNLCR